MKNIIRNLIVLFVIEGTVSYTYSQIADGYQDGLRSIDKGDLQKNITYLASDEMKGRAVGTDENLAAARYVAKNIVAAKLAKECLVQLSYAIGVAEPVSIYVDTKGTGKISDAEISKMIKKEVDLTPKGIINKLKLRNSIYLKTSSYGHFGRNEKSFTWEQLDLVPTFKKYLPKK